MLLNQNLTYEYQTEKHVYKLDKNSSQIQNTKKIPYIAAKQAKSAVFSTSLTFASFPVQLPTFLRSSMKVLQRAFTVTVHSRPMK
jgi:hypothetical protein